MFEKLLFTLIGASIGWVLSWHRYRVAENANLISDHIKDIEKFSEELRQHWTTSFAGVDPNEHRAEIAKIKSLHISVSSFYGEAEYRLGKARYQNYKDLQLSLFKIGMGGDFETIGRSICEETSVNTQSISWQLIQSLRLTRREQYGIISIVCSYKPLQMVLGLFRRIVRRINLR